MEYQTVRVPQMAFFGDTDLELKLPAAWEVIYQKMPGHDLPALSDDGIRQALARPIGAPTIRELAQGKKEAVIVFDDISRPTPISRLWPFVVEELNAAGISDDHIRFICALGMHGAHSRTDFVRKLGEEALRRFAVYNHNPYEHCTLVGETSRGTPVEVNDEFLACDVRIGIGAVLPHPMAGFGGGPKIILPGIVSWKTIYYNHLDLNEQVRAAGKAGDVRFGTEANDLWQDICETADLAGLQLKVDAFLNAKREVVGVIAGNHRAMRPAAVRRGREIYATKPVEADIAIANCYGKSNEATLCGFSPDWSTTPDKDLVIIATCPQGQVVHYLYGDFGANALGCGVAQREPGATPAGVRRLLVYTPYPEKSAERWFNIQGLNMVCSTWEETLSRLQEWHPHHARVAIYPDLTVQYLDTGK